ncbi:MAG: prephenate dehydrogenase [Clostridia bacterium]|nr:prephenate dehydrogenase [Clostridia bacterium]MBR6642349.1 prephenate dehydrogenase [Lachnospiraceae bacterium]
MTFKHFGFIGFGLIGGSIARAIKELVKETTTVTAFQYGNKPSRSLTLAAEEGILDTITTNLTDFSSCDMIFLCAPVQKNIEYLTQLKDIIQPDCLLTDVGSVKGNIHAEITALGLEHCFIGGHPMTGSEKTGYEHSSVLLLENAYYILTPTSRTRPEVLDEYSTLVKTMGAIPIVLDPAEHDKITAAISHVPHIIAAQLVNLIQNAGPLEPKMRLLAAGGFKDITRIASSSPEIWENICISNKTSICDMLTRYQDSLEEAKHMILSDKTNALYHMFDNAGNYRNSIPTGTKGALMSSFELFVDIKDETGALALLATLLSLHGISIKNIGIIHNREFEQGVLRIEFYDKEAVAKATRVLETNGYHIYLRK